MFNSWSMIVDMRTKRVGGNRDSINKQSAVELSVSFLFGIGLLWGTVFLFMHHTNKWVLIHHKQLEIRHMQILQRGLINYKIPDGDHYMQLLQKRIHDGNNVIVDLHSHWFISPIYTYKAKQRITRVFIQEHLAQMRG